MDINILCIKIIIYIIYNIKWLKGRNDLVRKRIDTLKKKESSMLSPGDSVKFKSVNKKDLLTYKNE